MNYWEKITTQMVKDRFNADEATAFANMSQGHDQLTALLNDTVGDVQGHIKAGGGQVPGDCFTPKSLRRNIVSMVIWDWITSYSKNEKLQTDARRDKYKEATEVMAKVRSGEFKVEKLDAGQSDDVESPVTLPSVGQKHHHFTRRTEDGI